ncbi:uncharacterized protein LOC132543446 [Ylistrum balloti]|uniref:uncharacterized protein LOC132543446 n=1 Tax=Ylistrum balloti TaxID=509963 RepID=UPI002905EF5C|nr:uncharacterized protein LOC132543446 [Ylistrum balloti]
MDQIYSEARSLSFLLLLVFNFCQGITAKEYCQTSDGVKECDTGCCGEHWNNNVSCCPFHPAAFIMIVLAVVLVVAFISYCIVSSVKKWSRGKTVIKPDISDDTKQASSISYVVVGPGYREKYPPILPPTYDNDQDWREHYSSSTSTHGSNYLPQQ